MSASLVNVFIITNMKLILKSNFDKILCKTHARHVHKIPNMLNKKKTVCLYLMLFDFVTYKAVPSTSSMPLPTFLPYSKQCSSTSKIFLNKSQLAENFSFSFLILGIKRRLLVNKEDVERLLFYFSSNSEGLWQLFSGILSA